MKYRKKCLAWALAVAMLCIISTGTIVFAADAASLDLSRTGSISVTLNSAEDDSTVASGALTLYPVADLILDNGNMTYVFTADFAEAELSLDNLTDTGLADDLLLYVQNSGLTGLEVAVDENGTASFTDLSLGLYLIVQSADSTEAYTMDAFLVTLPLEEGEAWVYDVDASPKVELTITPVPETETPDEETPQTDTSEPSDEETPDTGITTGLPQTGQLYWPIPILVAAGAACLAYGAYRNRRCAREQMMR